jgi:hypothetical protein
MRNNQSSFLNRVSFRRRTRVRETTPTILNNVNTNSNLNLKPIPNSTVAAMRSCIDTLSETANITPLANLTTPHEGSSSGKLASLYFFEFMEKRKFFHFISLIR